MSCFCNYVARLGAALACVTLLGANLAVGQHTDLEMFDDAGQVAVEPRIAEGEFGEAPNPAFRANEPGVESDPVELALHGETPLPGGALVGLDLQLFSIGGVSKSLFYWDGVGSVDFTSVPSPHQLKISDATESFSIQTDGSFASPGFDFDTTADGLGPDPEGFFHHDLIFDLVDAGGTGVPGPTAGIYAFSTTFSVAGLTDSEPVFWALASGVDESAHEAAVEFLQRLVPEPTSVALLGSFLFAAIGYQGRRSRN